MKTKGGSNPNRVSRKRSKRVVRGGMSRNITPYTYVPPQSRKVRLTWSGTAAFAEAAAGNGALKTYRLNGAYDVDTAVGSTSTIGFATWTNQFGYYRVWRTSVKVEGSFSGGSAGTLGTAVMFPTFSTTIVATPSQWPAQYMAIKKTVRADSSSGGRNFFVLENHYDIPTVLRLRKSEFKNDMDFTAVYNSVPARQAYVFVGGYSINSGSAMTIIYQIYVQMDVEFFGVVEAV